MSWEEFFPNVANTSHIRQNHGNFLHISTTTSIKKIIKTVEPGIRPSPKNRKEKRRGLD